LRALNLDLFTLPSDFGFLRSRHLLKKLLFRFKYILCAVGILKADEDKANILIWFKM